MPVKVSTQERSRIQFAQQVAHERTELGLVVLETPNVVLVVPDHPVDVIEKREVPLHRGRDVLVEEVVE